MVRARPAALALLVLTASGSGCGPSLRGSEGGDVMGPARSSDLDDAGVDETMLVIPPTGRTPDTVKRAQQAAVKGNLAAAWAELHYLIDLFDHARANGDKESRAMLLEHLAIPADAPDATGRVIAELLVRVDRILAKDRLHGNAAAARALLEQDEVPPSRRTELAGRVAALKAVARAGGPLAANARLRLVMMCARAMRDAIAAPTPARPRIIATCLYPMWDADPEPYFAPDPEARPPEPAWQDVVARMNEYAEQIRTAPTRIKTTGAYVANSTARALGEKKALLPTRRAPAELGVPMVDRAPPYDWTPIVQLGDGRAIAPDLGKKVAPYLALDGRRRLAVALHADAPASALVDVATLARAEGVSTLELVVGTKQTLHAPEGDYWHDRVREGGIERLGVLAVAIADTQAAGPTAPGRDRPREGTVDPGTSKVGLHLVVNEKDWRLVSAAGALPAIPAGDVAALRTALARVRDAYAEEIALVIVPGELATVGAVIQVVSAARLDAQGAASFSAISLGLAGAPKAKTNTLAARIDRRAKLTVVVEPPTLADRAPALRRCLQDLAEAAAPKPGTLALELTTGQATIVSGPKDAGVRACVTDRLGAAMVAQQIARASLTISAAP